MSYVELNVLVPEERVSDFYAMLGRWMGGVGEGVETDDENRKETAGPARTRRGRSPRSGSSNSRYAGIGEFLRDQNGAAAVAVSFEDLEQAIDNDLPASAARHRAWWANSERNTQARIWMEQGWRVDSVDLEERTVHFSRN